MSCENDESGERRSRCFGLYRELTFDGIYMFVLRM